MSLTLDKNLKNNSDKIGENSLNAINKRAYVIALGYFDGVHIGHRSVIEHAKILKEQLNAKLVVWTFKGNLKSALGLDNEKYIYSYKEREKIYLSLGADEVFLAPVDKNFLSMTESEFLHYINEKYNICAYVCGDDYKFGNGGLGNVETLSEFAKQNSQIVKVCPPALNDGVRISTSYIKNLLINGEIEKANELLSQDFFVKGIVEKGRGDGRKLGYPTANIKIDVEKQMVKNGVYCGYCMVEQKKYPAIINCGNCPTFNVDKYSVEVCLLDFIGDLYGKSLTVYFTNRLRDIKKFDTIEELKIQLAKDEKQTREIYD